MKIQDQIKIDLRKAMIGGHINRKNLLRTIIGEFNRIDKEISEDKALSIIKKMKENAEMNNNEEEINILSEYLPQMLTEKEISDYIDKIFENNIYTIKDMGKIMKELKEKFGQSIDMKIASNYIKLKLN